MSTDTGLILVSLDNEISTDSVQPFIARLQSLGWISEQNPARVVWKLGNIDHTDDVYERLNALTLTEIMLQKRTLNEPIFFYANFPKSKFVTSVLIDQNSIMFDLDDAWIDGAHEIDFVDKAMKDIIDLCFGVLGPFMIKMTRYVDRC